MRRVLSRCLHERLKSVLFPAFTSSVTRVWLKCQLKFSHKFPTDSFVLTSVYITVTELRNHETSILIVCHRLYFYFQVYFQQLEIIKRYINLIILNKLEILEARNFPTCDKQQVIFDFILYCNYQYRLHIEFAEKVTRVKYWVLEPRISLALCQYQLGRITKSTAA